MAATATTPAAFHPPRGSFMHHNNDDSKSAFSLRSFRVTSATPSIKASSLKLPGSFAFSNLLGARSRPANNPFHTEYQPKLRDLTDPLPVTHHLDDYADDTLLHMGLPPTTSRSKMSDAPINSTDVQQSNRKDQKSALQNPRSKSRTMIRMLTTRFTSHTSSANASAKTSASAPIANIRRPPAPTNVFSKEQRDAALRERGLLPPLPSRDLSEQEMEQDRHIPIVPNDASSSSHSHEGGSSNDAHGTAAAPSAADLIKKEWEARNHNVAAEQRARMTAFKFGGTAPPAPTAAEPASDEHDASVESDAVGVPSESGDYPTSKRVSAGGDHLQLSAIAPSTRPVGSANVEPSHADLSTPEHGAGAPPPSAPALESRSPPALDLMEGPSLATGVTNDSVSSATSDVDHTPTENSHKASSHVPRTSSGSIRALPSVPTAFAPSTAPTPAQVPLPSSPTLSPLSPTFSSTSIALQPPSSPPKRNLPPVPLSPSPSSRSVRSVRSAQSLRRQPPQPQGHSGASTPRASERKPSSSPPPSPSLKTKTRTRSRDDPLPAIPQPLSIPNTPVISFTPASAVSSPAEPGNENADDVVNNGISAFHMRSDSFAQLEEELMALSPASLVSSMMIMPSLSRDTTSSTESASLATPISPGGSSASRAPLVAKGKLGDLTVKTQHAAMAQVPVIVESPNASDGFEEHHLEVVAEESGVDEMGLMTNDDEDMRVEAHTSTHISTSSDDEAHIRTSTSTPGSPLPLPPLSPNRAPAVTITTPSPAPRTKKRGTTDPAWANGHTIDRRKSLFSFKRGAAQNVENHPESNDAQLQPQPVHRRLSVAASLSNLRRSFVGTISSTSSSSTAGSSTLSPRSRTQFDASHLPPSPTLPVTFANGNAATKTVLAPGSAPQLRRTAVAPVIHSRGSILLETFNIEDEESRRMTEMAFLG